MSLALISQLYSVESDSDWNGQYDQTEEVEKIVEMERSDNTNTVVKTCVKSRWDYDEEDTDPIGKSNFSSPESRLGMNVSPNSFRTCDTPADVLHRKRLIRSGSVSHKLVEKLLPTSVSRSSICETSLEKVVDASERPSRSNYKRKLKPVDSNQSCNNGNNNRGSKNKIQKTVCPRESKQLSNWLRVYRLRRRLGRIKTPNENQVKVDDLRYRNRKNTHVPVPLAPQKHFWPDESGPNNTRTLCESGQKTVCPVKTAKVRYIGKLKNNNADINKKGSRNKVETLWKCPYCFLIFALTDRDDLIQHLQTHVSKNSTVSQTENVDLNKCSTIRQVKNRGMLRKPTRSLKAPPVKSSQSSNLKFPKEMHNLRSCQIVLTRCDHLISADWKPLTTNEESPLCFDFKKDDLTDDGIRGGTKRRSAGINARRKMLMIRMQEGDDSENNEDVDIRIPDRLVIQLKDKVEPRQFHPKGSSKFRSSVTEQTNRLKHPNMKIKPHKCPTCSKCFVRKAKLEQHFQIHTGEKPYECPMCSKGFKQVVHLQLHIRTHTGEKPFECPTCSKGFKQLVHLQLHIRTHTGEKPFECPTCSKGFSDATTLKRHIRIHTGEKPYECPTCSKGFSAATTLKCHIRMHTGEKPFECPMCSKGFKQSVHLKRHIRIHTC